MSHSNTDANSQLEQTSRETADTQITNYIRELGPKVLSETPLTRWHAETGSMETLEKLRRKAHTHNVRLLWPRSQGTNFNIGVEHSPVVYHQTHSTEEIIERYMQNNQTMIEHSKSFNTIYCNIRAELPDHSNVTIKEQLYERYPYEVENDALSLGGN